MSARRSGSALEVLRVFLKLGLISFGGPIAHIGYFREEFVVRRRWIGDAAYSDLVALCQFLPGPASSQIGFSIGLIRAGYPGALAAWSGFTLPSAIALVLFSYGADALHGALGAGDVAWLEAGRRRGGEPGGMGHGAHAVPRPAASIHCRAGSAASICLSTLHRSSRSEAIVLGGIAGLWLCRSAVPAGTQTIAAPVSRTAACVSLGDLYRPSYRAAAAGNEDCDCLQVWRSSKHSIAPVLWCSAAATSCCLLLRDAFVTPGWVSDDAFLAGYGAAQAVPGPLFSFAAYLGAVVRPSSFGYTGRSAWPRRHLPSPACWSSLGRCRSGKLFAAVPMRKQHMRGINAAVVGLLGAALYNPVWSSSVELPETSARRSLASCF